MKGNEMSREPTGLFWLFVFCFGVCILFTSCQQEKDPLEKAHKTINSYEAVEAEILEIEKTVRERDARERLYHHFYGERDEILKIAEGGCNETNPLHRALIREMSWLVLAELKDRRPDFQLRVEREHPKDVFDCPVCNKRHPLPHCLPNSNDQIPPPPQKAE
jgi:hypothetical protein